MDRPFTLVFVEDSEATRILLEAAFSRDYRVKMFVSAEDCLAYLADGATVPDVFLLDVDLPGMDGYALCRAIRARQACENVPVLFLSGLDDIESRLDGYDAGGSDYIVKPYNLAELKKKISACLWLNATKVSSSDRVEESATLTELILANLDEYAALIQFLRSLNTCEHPRQMLDLLFVLLRAYHLSAAIQIRLEGFSLTVSDKGDNHPLEVAVMENMRKLDRIFEFKTRAAYNFDRITILIHDMPLDEPERCGRLRDNILIAAECADMRLLSQQTKVENSRTKDTVAGLVSALQKVVKGFERKYANARYYGSSLTNSKLEELRRAFAALAMSEEQELLVEGIVGSMGLELAEVFDFSGDMEDALRQIADRLTQILEMSPPTCMAATPRGGFEASASSLPVELF